MTFILVLLILIIAGLLVYIFYGDRILSRFQFGEDGMKFVGAEGSGYSETVEPTPATEEESGEPAGESPVESEPVEPEEPAVPEEPVVEEPPALPDYVTVNNLPIGLSVSPADFTVRVLGQVTPLQASGGAGSYAWVSRNPDIASVDQNGNVTPISNGITTILVTDGQSKGECIVRIYAGTGNSEGSENQLNRTDFTRKVSEGPYQLTLSGVTEGIRWTTTNPNVAAISDTGLVTPVSPGTATVFASWNGQSRVCTVRVIPED